MPCLKIPDDLHTSLEFIGCETFAVISTRLIVFCLFLVQIAILMVNAVKDIGQQNLFSLLRWAAL